MTDHLNTPIQIYTLKMIDLQCQKLDKKHQNHIKCSKMT